jgi:hypothetical protein
VPPAAPVELGGPTSSNADPDTKRGNVTFLDDFIQDRVFEPTNLALLSLMGVAKNLTQVQRSHRRTAFLTAVCAPDSNRVLFARRDRFA